MKENRYVKPTVRTLSARQLLESLGPVSCGSATGQFGGTDPVTDPVGRSAGGYKSFF